MSRISSRFEQLKCEGRKALIAFITAGDPDIALTERLVPQMAAAGADIIELGIPFSDPMADGPTIQLSSERSLTGGANLRSILAAEVSPSLPESGGGILRSSVHNCAPAGRPHNRDALLSEDCH